MSIQAVGIVAKSHLKAATPHLMEIGAWLEARGVQPVFETATAALLDPSPTAASSASAAPARRVTDQRTLVRAVGLVVVLGGDGTLLATADAIGEAGADIPILGINFGSLGFLTEVTLPELYTSLDAALAGHAHIEERMMLHASTRRGGSVLATQIALNDVVITKAARSRMIELAVSFGDEFVTRVKADGLIVASPTGSTAYNLAAGGPIVQANMDALILTPIAPHTLTNRPIVIPADAAVIVKPVMDERDDVYVTFDGQTGFQLRADDEIRIARADSVLRLVRPTTRSYFQVLRTKLKWGER